MRELALGLRLAATGGRGPRLRALLTAVGVVFGVFVLLVAASVTHMVSAHEARQAGRSPVYGARPARAPLLIAHTDTAFAGTHVDGLTVQARRAGAPVPPGLPRVPRAGEAYVSPAFARLLAGSDGELLRRRLGARVVGTIGDAGLASPANAAYVRGTDALAGSRLAEGVTSFGTPPDRTPLPPELRLLVILMVVALLFPVAVFVGTAVRFGGEDRDRRLAALRLVGASRAATVRIAAGETLLGALAGVAAGVVLFAVGCHLLEHVSAFGVAVFAQDVTPDVPLAAAGLVLVPLAAVLATLATLRGVTIEPLGVTRRARPPRRRLWWRFIPTLAGLAILRPYVSNVDSFTSTGSEYRASAGVLLVLAGLTTLLPWLVELVVRRSPSGPLPWLLAIRRLQLDGGTTGRVVGGIGVAVAGAIALQTVFSAAAQRATVDTGVDTSRVSMVADASGDAAAAARLSRTLARTRGVRASAAVVSYDAYLGRRSSHYGAIVADCASLRLLARIGHCHDGAAYAALLRRGGRVRVGRGGPEVEITEHARARAAPVGFPDVGVFVTPSALRGAKLGDGTIAATALLARSPADAADRVRTAIAEVDPFANVDDLRDTSIEAPQLTSLRNILFAGASLVLAVIGASLLVAALEQLRERRRVLAVLSAFGTRRRTLAGSVLCQTAIPVVLGLGLAVATGLLLGAVLLKIANVPVHYDWGATLVLTGAGAAVIAAVTALSMPVLWRAMRPEALRVE